MWQKIATKTNGWNSIDSVAKKLKIKKSTAYFYIYMLNKNGFIIQKIKKPRGTMYFISPFPSEFKHRGIYENSDLTSDEIELTKKEIPAEQKIAFFLLKYKKEKNIRYYNEAKKNIRNIKNWKLLYMYSKAYNVVSEIKDIYLDARKTIAKIPRMPKRYKKIFGV